MGADPPVVTRADAKRFREYWTDELAAAALYRALAAGSEGDREATFRRLAEIEQRHAAHWEALLREAGVPLRPPRTPARVRLLMWAARRFGPEAVLRKVVRMEAADRDRYRQVEQAPGWMADEEAAHGRTVALALAGDRAGAAIALSEARHRAGAGGALRASVFGVSDGLVSNFALVMGVAGGASDSGIVLLAGLAGLIAGAASMAAGEWVSVSSQRELYQREIEVEREEHRTFPQEEREELELILRAKGLPPERAAAAASDLMADPDQALDTHVREELGLDPDDLDSPWVAAGSSFASFAVGATVPILPYLLTTGPTALIAAAALSIVALMVVGALISLFTSRSALRSGLRMVAIGTLASAVTYGIGSLVGVALD